MAKEIKQTALEVAETQLQNIAEEQKRLKQSIKVIKCAVRDREILCDRLQKDAKEAIECARSLREKDTTLQERLHSAQSRVIAARDTPYEIEELNSLNSISVEIAMNNQRYKDALRRQEET